MDRETPWDLQPLLAAYKKASTKTNRVTRPLVHSLTLDELQPLLYAHAPRSQEQARKMAYS